MQNKAFGEPGGHLGPTKGDNSNHNFNKKNEKKGNGGDSTSRPKGFPNWNGFLGKNKKMRWFGEKR